MFAKMHISKTKKARQIENYGKTYLKFKYFSFSSSLLKIPCRNSHKMTPEAEKNYYIYLKYY
jgi:hypothetical protein